MKTKYLVISAALALGVTHLAAISAYAATMIYVSEVTDTITQYTLGGVGTPYGANFNGPATLAFNGPAGMAFDAAGNFYLANYKNDNILRITPLGVRSVFASVTRPIALRFDRAGNLFVASNTTYKVQKITPGGVVSLFADGASGVSSPDDLAFDSLGNLYVVNNSGNTIMKYAPDGTGSIFASSLGLPIGIAIDGADNIFVSNQLGQIREFPMNGTPSVFATATTYYGGLAFDASGLLYAANFDGHRIERFLPDGTVSLFVSTGAYYPQSITIKSDPVPEPAAFGLLAVTSLFWTARRRMLAR